jgi:hypothetical protein
VPRHGGFAMAFSIDTKRQRAVSDTGERSRCTETKHQ